MNEVEKLLWKFVELSCKDDNNECLYCYSELSDDENSIYPTQHLESCRYIEAFNYFLNRELDDDMTIGQCYYPAMVITDKETAEKWLVKLVKRHMRVHGNSETEALGYELSNIGYYSGYYSPEVAGRANRLFGAVHPVFGTMYMDVGEGGK